MDGSAEGRFSLRAICIEGSTFLQTLSAIAFVSRVSLVDANSPRTRQRFPRAYPKAPNCMFLPTGETPATKASSSDQGDVGFSVRGFSCPSSGVPHLHVVQGLLLPSPSSGAPLVRAVHGLLASVLCAACAPLLRGSSPRACGDTQAVASFPCSSDAYRVLVGPYHGGKAPKRGPRPGRLILLPLLAGLATHPSAHQSAASIQACAMSGGRRAHNPKVV
jgi:hypothetical protein